MRTVHGVTPLELLADALLVIGAGLAIAACALVSTALALAVAAVLCIATGAALTALAVKRPKRPRRDLGPFDPDTAA